jgi:hypothetical protein
MHLNKNKPMLQHVQTHEITFSRYIANGISWSDVIYIHVIHLLQLLRTRIGCSFFASNQGTLIIRYIPKGISWSCMNYIPMIYL